MARVPISFTGRVKGGPARGGLGRECRFYTDDTLAVAKTLFRREAGAGLQPVVIVPNAGIPRALAADRAAGDTFVTVAIGQTGSFNVGDLVPIWNAVQGTVYRVITVITPATGRLDLDQALGIAFTVANGTQVNATDMEGHVWGWADDATATWMQVKELGSNRLLAPVKVAAAAPALVIAIQDEGAVVNSRPAINFVGPNLQATDDGANNRVNVTDTAAPRAATYVVGAADATLTAELVLGTAVNMQGTLGARPAASLEGRLYFATDANGGILYRDTGAAWTQLTTALDVAAATFLVTAASGALSAEVPVGAAPGGELGGTWAVPTVDAVHSGSAHHARQHAMNDAADHSGSLPSADASLGADVSITVAGTYVDGPSVSLAAGTWLVVAVLTVVAGSTISNQHIEAEGKLWDGSTVYASAEASTYVGSSGGDKTVVLALVKVVTLGGTTTVKASATSSVGTNGVIKAATPTNGSGNNASRISAVKLGP